MKQITITLFSFVLALVSFSCRSNNTNTTLQATVDSLSAQIKTSSNNQKLLEDNKKLVAEFYQALFGDKDMNTIDKYVGEVYINHHPGVPDGKDALRQAITELFKENTTKEIIEIHHLGADGDFVYIHSKFKHIGKTFSIMDIFKLENGKIVEHWDVSQEVQADTINSHSMF